MISRNKHCTLDTVLFWKNLWIILWRVYLRDKSNRNSLLSCHFGTLANVSVICSITIVSISLVIRKIFLSRSSKLRFSRFNNAIRITWLLETNFTLFRQNIVIYRTRNCYRITTSRQDSSPIRSHSWALRKKLRTLVSLQMTREEQTMSFRLKLHPVVSKFREEKLKFSLLKEMLPRRQIQATL